MRLASDEARQREEDEARQREDAGTEGDSTEAEILPPRSAAAPAPPPPRERDEGWRIIDEQEGRMPQAPPDEHAETLPPEPSRQPPAGEDEADQQPFAPFAGDEGWLDLEGAAEADAEPPPLEGFGDLDSLIEQLENAPRIRPMDAPASPAGGIDDADEPEIVSETLARIYEAQGQFAAAARTYDALAAEQPARAEEFRRRAADLRSRSAE
jgi:hypothetical protein